MTSIKLTDLIEQSKLNDETWLLSHDGLEVDENNRSKKIRVNALGDAFEHTLIDVVVDTVEFAFTNAEVFSDTGIDLKPVIEAGATWLFINEGFIVDPDYSLNTPKRAKHAFWNRMLLQDVLDLPSSNVGANATKENCLLLGFGEKAINNPNVGLINFYMGRTFDQILLLASTKANTTYNLRLKYT